MKNAHSKWKGLLLGFLLAGSAHFLTGEKAKGVGWYLALTLTATLGLFSMFLPGIAWFIVAAMLQLVAVVMWIIMMKQSWRPVRRIGFFGWIAVLVITVALNQGWHFAWSQIIKPVRVASGPMQPTLFASDYVMVNRMSYRLRKPERGDIIVFSTKGMNDSRIRPSTLHISRIAGLPGETVQIDPPHLLINGEQTQMPVKNGYTLASATGTESLLAHREDQITLGDDEYLVLADNTEHSLDGRYYGPIKRAQFVGRVRRIYWPLSRCDQSF
jgi:signal peptidase I